MIFPLFVTADIDHTEPHPVNIPSTWLISMTQGEGSHLVWIVYILIVGVSKSCYVFERLFKMLGISV